MVDDGCEVDVIEGFGLMSLTALEERTEGWMMMKGCPSK